MSIRRGKYTVNIDTGSGVDVVDIHPDYEWETITQYTNFLQWLERNPDSWYTFQSIGPEVSVKVSRIVSITRIG